MAKDLLSGTIPREIFVARPRPECSFARHLVRPVIRRVNEFGGEICPLPFAGRHNFPFELYYHESVVKELEAKIDQLTTQARIGENKNGKESVQNEEETFGS